MTKRKSLRIIKVSEEAKVNLAKMFDCTKRMVYKALCYECDSQLARQIQYVARKEMGGWIEAAVPEEEIFYDTMSDGKRFMRQYFNNGAVIEIGFADSFGVVRLKGEVKKEMPKVMVKDIPSLQEYARSLC